MAQLKETDSYHYQDHPNTLIPIDTGLRNIEDYNFMPTDTWDYFNLGNTGQAHQYLALDWNDNKGFKSGMTHFDRYKYQIDKIKYYQIEKPISQINYFLGSKRENVFGAMLAHNIKNRLAYGVDFHRIQSTGVYNNMRSRNGNFSLYGIFSSKNSRYNLSVDMTFSQVKAEENGGIRQDFINNPENRESNKEFYEVTIDQGVTQHKNFDILITNSYHFGFSKVDSISDSLAIKTFYPSFSIHYSTGTQKNTYGFIDNAADTAVYDNFFQAEDSTFYRLYYHQIPNRISLSYSGLMKNMDSVQYRNFSLEAGVQHDNIELWQNKKEYTTNNLHVYGKIQSNPLSSKKWRYSAQAFYYLTGYNQHDWTAKGSFAYDFIKLGTLEVSGGVEQQEASWIEHSFFSTTEQWENDFSKKSRVVVSGDYLLPKYGFKLHGEYNILTNYIYFNADSRSEQLSSAMSYWQFYASKTLQHKIMHFDNFIGIQGNNHQEALRLPKVYLKSSFFLEGRIFKGKMLARFGADLRYNTQFAINAWNPLIGQYYIQNEQQMKFTPRVDVFVAFQVKTLRVWAKANYINEGLIQTNYFNALGYPDRGRTFAGGLIWRFLE